MSKWGFSDGDLLNWIRQHNREYDPHETLIACVERKLLPVLKQRVEILQIICIHNPCRAVTVDGVNVRDFWYEPSKEFDPPLSPDCVVLTGQEVLEIAEAVRLKSMKEKNPVDGSAT